MLIKNQNIFMSCCLQLLVAASAMMGFTANAKTATLVECESHPKLGSLKISRQTKRFSKDTVQTTCDYGSSFCMQAKLVTESIQGSHYVAYLDGDLEIQGTTVTAHQLEIISGTSTGSRDQVLVRYTLPNGTWTKVKHISWPRCRINSELLRF